MNKVTKTQRGRPPTIEAPRATILREASKLFAKHGFEGTSLQNIATAVGITKAAIYHYFPTKQAVYDAIVVDLLERLDETVRTRVAEVPDHGDKLKQLMIAHADFLEENYSDFITLLYGLAGLSRPICPDEALVRDRYESLVRETIENGTATGAFAPSSRDVTARAVLSLLNWMSRWYRPDGERKARDFASDYFELIYNGLRPR